ncbi:MAG: sensor histidine kinase [Bacteroidia bacterium]
MKNHSLIFIHFFLLLNFLKAAEPVYINYSQKNGLEASAVYQIYSSKSGKLYLGTNNGLFTFNGYTFNKIPFKNTLSTSISYIQEDIFGTIWGMNFSNQLFYIENEQLIPLALNENENKEDETLNEIKVKDSTIWLCFKTKITCINAADKRVKKVFYKKNLNGFNFRSIGIFKNRVFAFSTDSLIWEINDNDIEIIKKVEQVEIRFLDCTNYMLMYSKGKNNTYYTFDENKNFQKKYYNNSIQHNYILNVEYINDKIWYCTNNGIINLDDKSNLWLQKFRISDIEKDFQGNIWISSLDNGIFKLDKSTTFLLNNLGGLTVTAISAYKNQIIAGATNGIIYFLDTNGNIKKHFDFGLSNEIQFLKIFENKLFTSYGIINLDDFTKTKLSFGRDACFVENNYILTTSSYLSTCLLNIDTQKKFEITNSKFKLKRNISENFDGFILRDFKSKTIAYNPRNKSKYIGYFDDLYFYDENYNSSIIRLDNGERIICNDLVLYDNKIYAATQNTGIVIIENKNPGFVIKDIGEGNLNFKKIRIYNGFIYALSDAGIFKIVFNNDGSYKVSKEVQHTDNLNDFVVLNNKMFLGGSQGVLNQDLAKSNVKTLPILKINKVNTSSNFDNTLQFNYNKRDLLIEFELIDYSFNVSKVNANLVKANDTIILKIDKQQRSINFNALNSGKYLLWIKAVDNNGNYINSNIVNFSINKPYWQTWWFLVFIVFSLASIIYLVVNSIISRVKSQQSLKQKLINSQLASLRAQMNPHFIYNVLNSIQGLIYSGNKKDAGNILTKFSDLMRSSLTLTDNQFVTLKDEINTIQTYLELESYRFEPNDFIFKIDYHKIEDLSSIKIPAFIIQPHVENAIKHGLLHKKGQKILQIFFEPKSFNEIVVEITDNGIGRQASAEINKKRQNKPESFATNAIKERINLINKQYKLNIKLSTVDLDYMGKAAGTKVTLEIPVNYEE